jgi:hypothetical protein
MRQSNQRLELALAVGFFSHFAVSQIKRLLLYLRRVTETKHEDRIRPGLHPGPEAGATA